LCEFKLKEIKTMKTCPKCGKTFEDSKFCPACGTEVKDEPKAEGYCENDIKDNKIFALLSYIGPLFLVPVLAAPKSKYARFHANQGLVLFLAEIIIALPLRALDWVNGFIFGNFPLFNGWLSFVPAVIGAAISLVGLVVGMLALVLAVIGVINAFQGKANELPFIGKMRILK
jgi:uncharacterized membrane protein/ribosomal protein L32